MHQINPFFQRIPVVPKSKGDLFMGFVIRARAWKGRIVGLLCLKQLPDTSASGVWQQGGRFDR